MKNVNIVFVTDDNYAMPTCVTMQSAKYHKKSDSIYQIYVVGDGLSADSKRRLMEMNAPDFKVSLIEGDAENKYENVIPKTQHVSKAALYKFDLPLLLPDLDKVLYLDGDLLIQCDLTEIYDRDISEVYAGVVKDIMPVLLYQPSILKKLESNHKAYFNSGVMLLNLKKLRADGISEKLLDYRINGINFFMDQDALNMQFAENVIYFSMYDNFLCTIRNRLEKDVIEKQYQEKLYNSPMTCWQEANILHLTSPKKPWVLYMPYLSAAFRKYYDLSPYKDIPLELEKEVVENKEAEKIIEKKKDKLRKDRLDNYREELMVESFIRDVKCALWTGKERDVKIVVSLTSFPARIHEVPKTLMPIFNQTLQPDRIILWLTNEEFPGREADLPKQLLKLKEFGLEIRWAENLRAHTKYYYSMELCPDDIVITIDDDVQYSTTLVEDLYNSYLRHPNAVSTLRAHLITFDEEGSLFGYNDWIYQCSDYIDTPMMTLLATGVGGVLYPPHLLPKETFNKYCIKNLSLRADDIWLKFMEVMNNIPVVLVSENEKLSFVGETQQVGLCFENAEMSGNDECVQNLIAYYNDYHGNADTLINRMYKEWSEVVLPERRAEGKPEIVAKSASLGAPQAKKKSPNRLWNGIKNVIKKIVPPSFSSFKNQMNIIQNQEKQNQKLIKRLINYEKQNEERNAQVDEFLISLAENQKRILALLEEQAVANRKNNEE